MIITSCTKWIRKAGAELRKTATGILFEEFQTGSPEEAKVVEFILPAATGKKKDYSRAFNPGSRKQPAFMPIILGSLKEFLDCEMLIEPLRQFFGFLQKTLRMNLSSDHLLRSAVQSGKPGQLTQYFRTTFLGVEGARQISGVMRCRTIILRTKSRKTNKSLSKYFQQQPAQPTTARIPRFSAGTAFSFRPGESSRNRSDAPAEIWFQWTRISGRFEHPCGKLDAQYRHMVKLIESGLISKPWDLKLTPISTALENSAGRSLFDPEIPQHRNLAFTNISCSKSRTAPPPFLPKAAWPIPTCSMISVESCGDDVRPSAHAARPSSDFKAFIHRGFPGHRMDLEPSVEIIKAPPKRETDSDSGEGEEPPQKHPSGADEKESFVLGHLPIGEIHIPRKIPRACRPNLSQRKRKGQSP